MTILPLRRLFIERQIQPEMLSFVSTDEVVALFDMYAPLACRAIPPLNILRRQLFYSHERKLSVRFFLGPVH